MTKPMKKSTKILLGVLLIAVLLGTCFTCVGLYAKKEMAKPKFTMPPQPEQPSVTAMPTDAAQAADYILRLYNAAIAADDTEGSWHTDVRLEGEMQSPFAEPDEAVLSFIRSQAAPRIASFYPAADAVRMTQAQDVPALPLPAQALGLEAEQSGEDDPDGDLYFLTLTLDPACIDTQAMLQSSVYDEIVGTLAPAAAVERAEIDAKAVTLRAKIDRVTDQLLSVEVTRTCEVRAALTLTGAYAALTPDGTAEVALPYETTTQISFRWYGARFTQRAMAVKPGDMKALPAAVTVNAQATAEEYTLRFEASQPDALTIDADGVMTVKHACEDPVTITMTLEYGGKTYTDQLTVYVSEMEVAEDV